MTTRKLGKGKQMKSEESNVDVGMSTAEVELIKRFKSNSIEPSPNHATPKEVADNVMDAIVNRGCFLLWTTLRRSMS